MGLGAFSDPKDYSDFFPAVRTCAQDKGVDNTPFTCSSCVHVCFSNTSIHPYWARTFWFSWSFACLSKSISRLCAYRSFCRSKNLSIIRARFRCMATIIFLHPRIPESNPLAWLLKSKPLAWELFLPSGNLFQTVERWLIQGWSRPDVLAICTSR